MAAIGARPSRLTFGVLIMGGVGQQRRRENMHAILVEETQKLCLLRFLGGTKARNLSLTRVHLFCTSTVRQSRNSQFKKVEDKK